MEVLRTTNVFMVLWKLDGEVELFWELITIGAEYGFDLLQSVQALLVSNLAGVINS